MFGGAGTGCVTEIVLFNPTEKYQSTMERPEYSDSARIQLRHNGISLTDVKEIQRVDGRAALIAANNL